MICLDALKAEQALSRPKEKARSGVHAALLRPRRRATAVIYSDWQRDLNPRVDVRACAYKYRASAL